MTDPELPPTRADKLFAATLALLVILGLMAMIASGAGCGDDRVPAPDAPPKTWGDAQEVWATSWCSYAERCAPTIYKIKFPGGYDQCVGYVRELNCTEGAHSCDELYPPERDEVLGQCSADMTALPCGETRAPDSCYEALQ